MSSFILYVDFLRTASQVLAHSTDSQSKQMDVFFCKEQSDKQLHSSVQADLEAGWSKTRKYTERLWKISVTLFVTVASWQTGITDPFSKHLSDKMP